MAERADESTSSPQQDESLDRISGLPDFLLRQILSLLPMTNAVRTAMLSKRWQYLWSSVPVLDFSDPNRFPEDEFVKFVDRTLILYEGSKIRKFRVAIFEYRALFASHVDSWIRFVVRKNVEDLDVDLSRPEDGDLYKLPQHLYSIAYLTKLRFRFCQIRPLGLISWTLLKFLSLSYIHLSDDLIQDILLGSPSLTFLDLQECRGLMHLNLTSPSLKQLIVQYDECDSTESDSVLEISAPHIQSMAILGVWDRRLRLMNLPCLIQVILKFQVIPGHEGYHDILREVLEKLHHVIELTIGPWCIQHLGVIYASNKCFKALKSQTIEEFCRLTGQISRHWGSMVLSTWELKILPSPSSKHKYLILNSCLNNWDLPGIANLLRSSPDLKILVVDMTFPSSPQFDSLVLNDFDGENYWKSTKPFFHCLLYNLTIVKIVGFTAGHGQMDLVQFLLKHAVVLEKMVIYSEKLAHLKWRKRFKPEELLVLLGMMIEMSNAL
ncbi:hypothetical protein HHK36_023722 [Tetracentron sinense]|uniref:F-box domain-containing protein n=1 Tax=Tetracentron sinense TaxID=13715 RepID=A0A834YSX0_TETSI|nr:hypothetical protein HHK36_023722 [Tetracentron sinense]